MNKRFIAATIIFAVFALIYFLPVEVPHKICIPMLTLFAFAIGALPWQMCCAMLFSALGDYAGSCHNFLAQMGFFAMAHVFMIVYFVKMYFKEPRDWRLSDEGKSDLFAKVFLVLSTLIIGLKDILPHAPAGVIQIGVAIYCVLITCMLFFASRQRMRIFSFGAALFFISDYILAYNKFVKPVPYEKYLIMLTYYLGQYLLFFGTMRKSLGSAKESANEI